MLTELLVEVALVNGKKMDCSNRGMHPYVEGIF
jgi:hypothetical protein